MTTKDILETIEYHLADQKLSYDDLAFKMCCHTEFVKKMMTGDYCFTISKLIIIGLALNVKLINIQIGEESFSI